MDSKFLKKSILGGLMLSALAITSCDNEDDNGTNPTGQDVSVVLNEVNYASGDWLEIYNNGSEVADLSNYWLCLGPGSYQQLSSLTPQAGSVNNLSAGEYLVLPYTMPDEEGGLGLYSTNEFTNAEALVDFVQWGAGSSAREDVAVSAGLWTAGDFVPTVSDASNSIIFDGEGNGVANWAETSQPTPGAENVLMVPEPARSIIISEVQYGNQDQIEFYNNGEVTIDLSSYWLCLGPGTYVQVGSLTPTSGDIQVEAGDFVVLPYAMPDDEGGLGLYSMNQFANPAAIMDFVQWGAGGSAREDVAVSAGIWTAGQFVPTVRLNSYSIEVDMESEGNLASDWSEEVNPSLGAPNDADVETTTFNVTISNVTNYLNVHTFTTPVGATSPGPLNVNGAQYQIEFKAVPGTKFTPVTMMGNSNDWFLAPTDLAGIDLFPNGTALNNVDIANQLSLYDLGTEADGMPESFPPAGTNVGAADSDPTVRLVSGRPTGEVYMNAVLTYAAGAQDEAGTFTLTMTAINAPDANQAASQTNGFVVTPGIVVLHALPEPLFTLGAEDRQVGLERIAEDGMPSELYGWFTETGTNGAPLRLSSSLSVFSPGLIYAFNTTTDPLFTQGEAAKAGSGIEELAEDGNNQVAVDYITSLGLPVAASNETVNIGPGEDLTFEIEVPAGQNYKLGMGTMLVQTNDWFVAYNNSGVALWDANGVPTSGTSNSARTYLYDAGTEVDQAVGFGADQAPRQAGPNQGAVDGNTIVRRVAELTDVQFGKGAIANGPGTTYLRDPRGGYNIIRVDIQPQ
ncbi:spondin domain-containing protein [Roseivirga sp. E12]|uniref:spondin domain-containing protein n=1 Tax=Roseivirga sp. E12 TaxID=2819237 RepID=UPI001ABCDE88|nr:spondin domain-containing protein [Roseivirga sp. E12]MBO3700831.1 spondin domain-containing protein [Roseivirga sp. E12]